jgi:hypothetical protein
MNCEQPPKNQNFKNTFKKPERIRAAMIDSAKPRLRQRANEIDYPIEAIVEMAIASFLDTEALGFVDCKPGRGQ